MGPYYVEAWMECLKKHSGEPPEDSKHKRVVILLIVLAVISVLVIIWGLLTSRSGCIQAGVILAVLASFVSNGLFSYWDSKVSFSKKIEHEQSLAIEILPEYLKRINASAVSLPDILTYVKEYYELRSSSRKLCFDRSFAFLVCGLFVFGLGQVLIQAEEGSSILLAFAILVSVISLFGMLFMWMAWDIRDSLRKASVSNTKTTIRALECLIVHNKESSIEMD
ncbi:MAG: hypothetical protein KHX01_03250 [Eggerthella sp.]|nr:hypothetical protein [Eggerthella sp.]